MEGYVKAPHSIVRDQSLSAMAKVAWLLIAGMPQGYHPTRDQWMAMLPCGDKRTWWRVIHELEQAGLIEVSMHGTKKIYTAIQSGVESHPLRVENNTNKGCETTPLNRCENAPYKKNIEEQEKNNAEMRARLREEVTTDMMVEMGCRSAGVTAEQYITLADEIFNDWEFAGQDGREWNKQHFLSVLRIKARELKRENNGQRIINADPVARRQMERQQRVQEIAAATAAFAAQGKRAADEVF